MSKIALRMVCTLICIIFSLSFVSCSAYDFIVEKLQGDKTESPSEENNNGNNDAECSGDEIFCYIETREELLVAMEKMKAHGTEWLPFVAFDCEGMLCNGAPIDVKYMISFFEHGAEPLTAGQDFFSRNLGTVQISCFIYDHFVSAKDVYYGRNNLPAHVSDSWLFLTDSYTLDDDFDREIEDPALLSISYFPRIDKEITDPNYYFLIEDLVWPFEQPPLSYYIHYGDEFVLRLPINYYTDYYTDTSRTYCPDPEFAREFVKTLVIIE